MKWLDYVRTNTLGITRKPIGNATVYMASVRQQCVYESP